MHTWRNLYNGEWKDALSGDTSKVINPATGEQVAVAAYGGAEDAKAAAEAAAAAFPKWAATPAKERAALLHRLADLLERDKDELARLITREMGKPLKEATGEVAISADYLRWNAEEAVRVYGKLIPSPSPDKRLLTLHQPVGPVAAITPWNFPLSMGARKLAPALAAGCTVVHKPAGKTPGAAVRFVELAGEAGFSEGVVNLVMGRSSEIGEALLTHPAIRKVAFTGSTAVGKKLMELAAGQVKKISMELGGHAPFLVFDDADLDAAALGAIGSKFRNAGQTCICANRIYVQASIRDAFLERFEKAARELIVGDGMKDGTTVGPLIDEDALAKVDEQVKDAVDKGATVVLGGKRSESHPEGCFYEPTILAGVNERMTITHEETFGPVAPVYTFETEEEALCKANDTEYGLAAYYYTRDLGRAVRVYEGLQYGIIGCNDAVPTTVEGPFGGWKESGIGREGGPGSLSDFLETKFVSMRLG
ncbi:NAD-dependent succinate-semialdehyde dehydrogenase [Paenibacillus sp. IB182496]|uniref:NAD-dependent succinate-semialdehyde dehydrogenase n=1 Tax=Paenibacillus sabuli TaxID=2772509 RepID=A0A927BQN9_9BACL|nr:NAD-dependent succinate-semialdehyde dehydrogenase [Paenibacillus sabuli]MBD2843784.1 NAD-dependent succinate-semialdehyde dehydrogenase [Paenibacillus sabuli]